MPKGSYSILKGGELWGLPPLVPPAQVPPGFHRFQNVKNYIGKTLVMSKYIDPRRTFPDKHNKLPPAIDTSRMFSIVLARYQPIKRHLQ